MERFHIQDIETGLYFLNGRFDAEEPEWFGESEALAIMRGPLARRHPNGLALRSATFSDLEG
jgi:hypothetical protein